jgi:hypothetical protein
VLGLAALALSVLYNTYSYKKDSIRFVENFLRLPISEIEKIVNKIENLKGHLIQTKKENFDDKSFLEDEVLPNKLSAKSIRNKKQERKKTIEFDGLLWSNIRDTFVFLAVLSIFAALLLIYSQSVKNFYSESNLLFARYLFSINDLSSMGIAITAVYEYIDLNMTSTMLN